MNKCWCGSGLDYEVVTANLTKKLIITKKEE